jgi:DNA-binding CsgD family transcriptional regulator
VIGSAHVAPRGLSGDPKGGECIAQETRKAGPLSHSGFHLRLIVNEVFGAGARYMEAGGFRLAYAEAPAPAARGDDPRMFVLRRESIAPGAIHPLSFLFHAAAPRLGFSVGQQRVLHQALLNRSDTEIASALGISLDAVKKTWRRIYERVTTELPYLSGVAGNEGRERRAAERRRHLLEYLRHHMEEIRPWPEANPRRTRVPAVTGQVVP